MGALSRRKGARWERAVAAMLRPIFGELIKIERGVAQGRFGSSEAADVSGVPRIWIETKHGQLVNLRAALEQARTSAEQARAREVAANPAAALTRPLWPVAICKDNRTRPVVVMDLEDWLQMTREWWHRSEPSDLPRTSLPAVSLRDVQDMVETPDDEATRS